MLLCVYKNDPKHFFFFCAIADVEFVYESKILYAPLLCHPCPYSSVSPEHCLKKKFVIRDPNKAFRTDHISVEWADFINYWPLGRGDGSVLFTVFPHNLIFNFFPPINKPIKLFVTLNKSRKELFDFCFCICWYTQYRAVIFIMTANMFSFVRFSINSVHGIWLIVD